MNRDFLRWPGLCPAPAPVGLVETLTSGYNGKIVNQTASADKNMTLKPNIFGQVLEFGSTLAGIASVEVFKNTPTHLILPKMSRFKSRIRLRVMLLEADSDAGREEPDKTGKQVKLCRQWESACPVGRAEAST